MPICESLRSIILGWNRPLQHSQLRITCNDSLGSCRDGVDSADLSWGRSLERKVHSRRGGGDSCAVVGRANRNPCISTTRRKRGWIPRSCPRTDVSDAPMVSAFLSDDGRAPERLSLAIAPVSRSRFVVRRLLLPPDK